MKAAGREESRPLDDLFQAYASELRRVLERQGHSAICVDSKIEAARYSFMSGIHSLWNLMQETRPSRSFLDTIYAEIEAFARECAERSKAVAKGVVH